MKEKISTMRVHMSTKKKLDNIGVKNQSYDSIIDGLIEIVKVEDNPNRIYEKINNFYHWALKHMFLTRFWIYCSKCKKKRAIQLHHKNNNKNDNEFENIEFLCRKCHLEEHYEFSEKRGARQ